MFCSVLAVLLVSAGLGSTALPAAGETSRGVLSAPAASDADTGADAVGATALPTVQVDGVVWNQVAAGDIAVAGGSFSHARPAGAKPGQDEVARHNLLAYRLSTGKLIDGFAPAFNGEVKNMIISPDLKTLYVVGTFTKVGDDTRNRVAAFDTSTGALLPFAPDVNGPVYGVKVLGSIVYLVGGFTVADGSSRTKAAAFTTSGGLTGWAPEVQGGDVRQLVISPDQTRIVLGGNFTSVDGSTQGYGLAMVGAAKADTLYPMPINKLVRNGATSNSGIYDLAGSDAGFSGTGWGNSQTLEGAFVADWSGNLAALEDCHGDTYSVYPAGAVLYTASHAHYCANLGSFSQSNPQTHSYAMAWGAAQGAQLSADPTHYKNWAGTTRPAALAFYPDFTAGSYTGQGQATWDVTGSGGYILYGGEFTEVNGRPQQGLVRFAARSVAPSVSGPVAPAGWAPSVKAYGGGLQRIRWSAIRDRDDETLSYQLIKNGDLAHPVYRTTATADFWRLPDLGFLERGLKPGDKATYQVRAIDSDGNVTLSGVLTTTYAYGIGLAAEQQSILAADPEYLWTASAAGASTKAPPVDLVGSGKPLVDASVRSDSPGVLGKASSAFRFHGNDKLVQARAAQAPNVFTISAWFKTTSTAGGSIINMGNTQQGDSAYRNPAFDDPANPDRTIYLSPNGSLNFGVWAAGPHVVSTGAASGKPTKAYNDGAWHQAVATMDLSGMKFYVDGRLIDTLASTYAGINITGYWRIGGDKLTGWPGNPTTGYYTGDVDQIAIYRTALTPAQIAAQYAAR